MEIEKQILHGFPEPKSKAAVISFRALAVLGISGADTAQSRTPVCKILYGQPITTHILL